MLTTNTLSNTVTAVDRVAELVERVTAALAAEQRLPEATYRLQFHAGFTFRDAVRLVPYLDRLGITDAYTSPYLKARSGSKHGYDICDHRVLNPEIGTEADFEAWASALHSHGLGQILDMVPNHMGIVGNENVWWNDVLENGPCSPYAGYFDIAWQPTKSTLHQKVLLPILGDPYGKVLESGQLALRYADGTFRVHYYEHQFPVAPDSVQKILRHRLPELKERLGRESPDVMEYESILTALTHLPARCETAPEKVAERQREKEVVRRRLAALVERAPAVRQFLDENLAVFNGHPGDPHSFDVLDDLLNDQSYRLSSWRVASDEINYRRFFDVNELAALSMEKPEVFAATHTLIMKLLRERKLTGLRIDHPDGLYDPSEYLRRLQQHYVLERGRALLAAESDNPDEDWKEVEGALRQAVARAVEEHDGSPLWRPLYVAAEKILDLSEPIPDWPVHGTTGYTFLNMVNGLFVDRTHASALTRLYHRWGGVEIPFRDLVYQKKFLILQVSMSSELHMLAHQLDRLAQKNRWSRDFTLNSLRHALREIIACFPVYRSYIADGVIHDHDRRYVERAVARAKQRNPAISASIFDFVRDMLLLRYPESATEADRAEQRQFVGKFQQVTGPVMAKGAEDTAFYVYNRLVSLNEVGGDPDRYGVTPGEFHDYNQERQAHWPHALSATTTHDTKRSEDVRARINVLSEMPVEWRAALARWSRLNRRHRLEQGGLVAPDRNDEYLFYQTLVGAWPLGREGDRPEPAFIERIRQYMQKAIREAKVHSSWINPNPVYDEAVARFVGAVLDDKTNGRFVQDFRTFQKRVSHYGLFNSLGQVLLKIAAPGVPDIYRGTELWDLSLVDPDNRRPVDYELRQQLLRQLEERAEGNLVELVRELVGSREDGRIKLYVTWRALHCRRDHPGLFTIGEYLPAPVPGPLGEHVCAFVRHQEAEWAVAVAPRLLTRLVPDTGSLPQGPDVWQDAVVTLPGVRPGLPLRNVFTGEMLVPEEHGGHLCLRLADILGRFPVALLVARG
jgi:(1->4)-alpha-D-glucan 1-alpha-D-glucosylmutase